MTQVLLRIERPDASGDDQRAVGTVSFQPTRRRGVGDAVVLPHAFSAVIGSTIELAPTGPDWCWYAVERTKTGIKRYVIVPDSPNVIPYVDLVDVDPTTFDPTEEPEAAWWAVVNGKVDQPAFDAHVSDTTAVHGIADTSVLETQAGAQGKADAAAAGVMAAHLAQANPHPVYGRLAAANVWPASQTFSNATPAFFERPTAPEGKQRWRWWIDSAGEGINLIPVVDGGTETNGSPIYIYRDGRFGHGGILEITGTGNPNGVHAAPVGSRFVNTEPGGYNGARVWRKDSGSGTSGWVVVEGDTGWIDIANLLVPDELVPASAAPKHHMRRINNKVRFALRLGPSEAIRGVAARHVERQVLYYPTGFFPSPEDQYNVYGAGTLTSNGTWPAVTRSSSSGGRLDIRAVGTIASGVLVAGDSFTACAKFTTHQPWPTTLTL